VTFSPRRQRRPAPPSDDVETRAYTPVPPEAERPEAQPANAAPSERLERIEERLVPRVTRHQAGTVRLRRHVIEEPQEVEVTLRHDELDLERRSADRPLRPDEEPVTERGDTTVVLVVEERLEVRAVPWVVEEIHLRRRLVSERRRVSDTVRKERYDVQAQGDVELNDHT
jgi:uncharacterized protein (TIGR02271 family)